jgi:hypothetical protein
MITLVEGEEIQYTWGLDKITGHKQATGSFQIPIQG